MLLFDVLTLFPGIFESFLSESVLKNALDRNLFSIRFHNIRDWAGDKHNTVDDRPFGGGPGMVLKVDCVVPCVEQVLATQSESGRLISLTPQGKPLTQPLVEELAKERRIVLLCGRYEGFDERIAQILTPEEISIGDYILNGGEVAAMAVIEAVMRLIPGVLGDEESNRDDSFSRSNRLLEFPQYTRPREYRGLEVPEILLSGNHGEIAKYREEQSRLQTLNKRPELLVR